MKILRGMGYVAVTETGIRVPRNVYISMGLNEILDRLAKEREARENGIEPKEAEPPKETEPPKQTVIFDRDEYDLLISACRMLYNSSALKKDINDPPKKAKRKAHLRYKMHMAMMKIRSTLT